MNRHSRPTCWTTHPPISIRAVSGSWKSCRWPRPTRSTATPCAIGPRPRPMAARSAEGPTSAERNSRRTTDMQIRKIFTQIEDIQSEAGRDGDTPLRKGVVLGVVKNPFAGQPYREDLSDLTDASAAVGREITARAVEAMAPYEAVSYGKGGVVGLGGEQEHAVAMLTTVYGNVMREAIGGG